ncbi:MAG: hypothetical protein KDB00_10360 [Planctomycetales bacterium]|nr:hypothetical protein [Planctomycetales bacterium]
MSDTLRKYTVCTVVAGLFGFVGCTPATTPTGPEKGSVQAYLDENPDVAARIDEGGGEETEGDGTAE